MATVKEEFELLKTKILAGKGGEKIHVVWHEAERQRRRENKKQSTRFAMETYSPQSYSELHEERERFIRIAVDPSLAVQLMIRALAAPDESTLRQWLKDGPVHPGDQPTKAEIPDWAKL